MPSLQSRLQSWATVMFPKASDDKDLQESSVFLSEGTLKPMRTTHVSHPSNSRMSQRSLFLITCVNVIILGLTICLATHDSSLLAVLGHGNDNARIKAVDFYSPVYDEIDISISKKQINGSLVDLGESIYRAHPSPEVDAAWERIGSLLPHVISTEDVIKLGKDPTRTARWPEEWGFGAEAHMAELDVLHTIHCLNAIRRDVHWKHYFIDMYPDGDFPELHKTHTDHCIYIVLQNLMCSATADLVTMTWVEGQQHPFPDFSVNKQCRNFDALLDWHETTMVTDMARFTDIRIPPSQTPWRMSPEFHRQFGTDLDLISHDHHM